ncbi:hypothetical protein [Rhodococcus sp. IEGM 1318]|uniref:hypothetical protein n=1 Tax=Rhodococcus sp. IEGM 1318 TaxID=3082226 RepID=UPI002953F0FA|nr:hypothetical protein [Rhodococcus sp. IEGM 1318]MDV8004555.1 hypothetical protein [Rhodococcus sp. IEGM 1318]
MRNNDIDAVREIEASDTENAREMRNLSPLPVLLSEPERLHVIADLRTCTSTNGC